MKTVRFFSLLLVLLVSGARADQRDYDGRREGARVIIYQHAGYRGDALVLYPGESLDNLSGKTFESGTKLNDSISSIWIEGGAEVLVYENARYRGEALRLTESVRDLTGRFVSGSASVSWNDRISSIKVERVRGKERDRERSPERPRENSRVNPDKIIKDSFNDLLGREPRTDELRLFRERFSEQGWTERMLRDHLRREEVYRAEAADRITVRAFRDIFGREPDERALRVYRRNQLEREWTEGDVRDDLRKSPEASKRPKG